MTVDACRPVPMTEKKSLDEPDCRELAATSVERAGLARRGHSPELTPLVTARIRVDAGRARLGRSRDSRFQGERTSEPSVGGNALLVSCERF